MWSIIIIENINVRFILTEYKNINWEDSTIVDQNLLTEKTFNTDEILVVFDREKMIMEKIRSINVSPKKHFIIHGGKRFVPLHKLDN